MGTFTVLFSETEKSRFLFFFLGRLNRRKVNSFRTYELNAPSTEKPRPFLSYLSQRDQVETNKGRR